MFYDGMSARKLKWEHSQTIPIPNGFKVNQMWYIRREQIESSILPEEAISLEDDNHQNSAISLVDDNHQVSEPHERAQIPLDINIRVVAAKLRKVGISTGVVAAKGPLPKCSGCGTAISRGACRILFTQIINENRNWKRTLSFHKNDIFAC